MRALLARLRLDGGRRRRRLALVGVGLGALVLGAAASATLVRSGNEATPPCASADVGAAEVWNERVRTTRATAFHETGLAFADDVWRAAAGELDAYVEQWRAQRIDACEDTRVRGESSDLMLERRNACLDRSLLAVRSLLDALEAPGLRAVSDTLDAVDDLPDLDRCDDPTYLASELEPPPPELEEPVRRIRSLLADADARHSVGDFAGATQKLGEAKTLVEGVDYGPVEVEVEVLDAELQIRIEADSEGGAEKLRRAYFRGRELLHHDAAAEAALLLGYTVGYRQQRDDLGRIWVDLGETELRIRGGLGPAEQIRLLHLRSAIDVSVGKFDQSVELTRKALSIALESEPTVVPAAHLRLAAVLDERGDFEEARGHYAEGVRLRESLRGPSSPDLIAPLSNYSLNALDRGALDEAEALARRAKVIAVKAYGADHAEVAEVLLNLGVILSHGGDNAGAEEEWGRALEILLALPDPNQSTVALLYSNLGIAAVDRGDIERGLELQRKAMKRAAEHLGEDHPDHALYVFNAGTALFDLGRYDESLVELERACTLSSEIMGDTHWRTYSCQVAQGRSLRELDRVDDALPMLEAAVQGLEDVGAPPTVLADARRGLAVTLGLAGKDRTRQRELLEQAIEVFEAHGLDDRVKEARRHLAQLK